LAPLARCRIDYAAIWNEAEPSRLGATERRALARPHAAIFHALHMAIDHFDVPALALIDLARLLPTVEATATARGIARAWHCERPLATALALGAAFLPRSFASPGIGLPRRTLRVIENYGSTAGLPRAEQLIRKVLHFDSATEAIHYLAVQSRRGLSDLFERRLRRRSARQRLGLSRAPHQADPSSQSR
jgi:hypothetical protein